MESAEVMMVRLVFAMPGRYVYYVTLPSIVQLQPLPHNFLPYLTSFNAQIMDQI
jgi:hypothetical protein